MRVLAPFLLFLLVLPRPAPAGDDTCAPDPALIRDLITWIGQETGYDIAQSLAAPPRISFCESGAVIRYEGRAVIVDDALRAAYDLPAQMIYLVRPWRPGDPYDVSILLHELTHHIQLQNRAWDCIGAPEWEAYQLQEKWLAARGVDPGFDWLHIFMLSRCPRDIHPD